MNASFHTVERLNAQTTMKNGKDVLAVEAVVLYLKLIYNYRRKNSGRVNEKENDELANGSMRGVFVVGS